MPVLLGQCLPLDRALPFGPFLAAVRRFFAAEGQDAPSADPLLAGARRQLAPLLSTDASALQGDAVHERDAHQLVFQQHQIFTRVLDALQLLAARARPQPLVIVLEDLHWADATSLALLLFLAQQLDIYHPRSSVHPASGLVLLGTYRREALADNPALRRLLLQLHAQRHLRELDLAPLSPAAHHQLVAELLGQSVSATYAAQLYARDEGNPFYAEELLSALAASGQVLQSVPWVEQGSVALYLPLSLKAAIVERTASLAPDDQDALAWAAVIGRTFDFDLLAAVCSRSEQALVALLRRAVDVQLISELPPGDAPNVDRYQFRHALTREAIYGELLTRERRMRHRRVAETISALVSQAALTDDAAAHLLAEHYTLAGLPEQARPHALYAAARARQLSALEEERHYLLLAVPHQPPEEDERLAHAERLGLLSLTLMDMPAALSWFTTAKDGYQARNQPRRAAAIMVHLTFLAWFFDTAHLAALDAELNATATAVFHDPAAQDVDAVALYAQNAFTLCTADQHAEARRWAAHAFDLAGRLHLPPNAPALHLGLLADALASIEHDTARVAEALPQLRSVIDAALAETMPNIVALGYTSLLQALVESGLHHKAGELIDEIDAYERRSGAQSMANVKGWQHFWRGDWGRAADELEACLAAPAPPTLTALYHLTLAHILLARGEDAQAHLDAGWPTVAPMQWVFCGPAMWGYAKLYAARGEQAQAAAWYERFFTRWQATDDRGTCVPALLDGIAFWADQGQLRAAQQWLATLRTVAGTTHNPVAAAALHTADAIVHAALGDLEQARDGLEHAAGWWSALHRPYEQARALGRLLTLLLDHPECADALRARIPELFAQAERIFEQLGSATQLAALAALRARDPFAAQQKRRATLAERRRPFAGLTRREVQVLIELSAGRTNKEIAATLQISEGTVEVHVSHILSKLDLSSRTQAATFAIEHGWLKSTGNPQ